MTEFARANNGHGLNQTPLSEATLREMPEKNPDQLFMVSLVERPHFQEAMAEIEYTLYPPDTEENAKFELMLSKWPDGEPQLLWATIVVPKADRERVEPILKKFGLRLVRGIPAIIDGGSPKWFPLPDLDNVFVIEGGLEKPVTPTPELN